MFFAILDVIVLGLVGFYAYEFYVGYKAATGSTWQRVLAGARGSATILWMRFTQLVAGAVAWLVSLSDFFNAPSVGTAIQQYLKPEYVAAAFVVIAVIGELARRRTGSSNPTS